MQSKATTPDGYLAALPPDRREALEAVRAVVNRNLDPRIVETMTYGMLGWVVPLDVYPAGYHCAKDTPLPFASLASQKNHMALYLFCVYCDPDETARVAEEWKASGKRLDMGKSCLRFKKLEDVPLDVLGKAVKRMTLKRFLAAYEGQLGAAASASGARKDAKPAKKASKKAPARGTTKKKSTAKEAAPKKKAAARKAPARAKKRT